MNSDFTCQNRHFSISAQPLAPTAFFRVGLVVVFFLALLPYSTVHRFGFVNWDDNIYVIERPEIHRGLTSAGIHWAFTTFGSSRKLVAE